MFLFGTLNSVNFSRLSSFPCLKAEFPAQEIVHHTQIRNRGDHFHFLRIGPNRIGHLFLFMRLPSALNMSIFKARALRRIVIGEFAFLEQ